MPSRTPLIDRIVRQVFSDLHLSAECPGDETCLCRQRRKILRTGLQECRCRVRQDRGRTSGGDPHTRRITPNMLGLRPLPRGRLTQSASSSILRQARKREGKTE